MEVDNQYIVSELQARQTDTAAIKRNDEAKKIRDEFRSKFGPDVLKNIKEDEVIAKLFSKETVNRDSLFHYLEYNKNNNQVFGGIAGGNDRKCICKYDRNSKTWVFYESSGQKEISEDGAIKYSMEIIDTLIKSCEIVDKHYSNNEIDYSSLYEEFEKEFANNDIGKIVIKQLWFMKYLNMLYPNLLVSWYNEYMLDQPIKYLEISDGNIDITSEYKRRFIKNGSIANFCRNHSISTDIFYYLMQWERIPGVRIKTKKEGNKEMEDNIQKATTNNNETPINKEKAKGENLIVYGVPGVGKSHYVDEEYKLKGVNKNFFERVVFHPDYTYSDFVGQIMPNVDENGKLTYKFEPGPFTRILARAINDTENKYYLVIEEINRGNAAAIFGDIFQLLDREKDGTGRYDITNKDIAKEVYGSSDSNKKIRIPSNLSIIATMNTSDQNVYTLDTAFQRRWKMHLIPNKFKEDKTDKNYIGNVELFDSGITWREFCEKVNKKILDNNSSYISTEDKRLGIHFVSREEIEKTEAKQAFAEKVLKYLWDDAFKNNREELFNKNCESLEDVIDKFKDSKDNGFAAVLNIEFNDVNNESSDNTTNEESN